MDELKRDNKTDDKNTNKTTKGGKGLKELHEYLTPVFTKYPIVKVWAFRNIEINRDTCGFSLYIKTDDMTEFLKEKLLEEVRGIVKFDILIFYKEVVDFRGAFLNKESKEDALKRIDLVETMLLSMVEIYPDLGKKEKDFLYIEELVL